MNAMYLVRPGSAELDTWSSMLSSDPETSDGADKWNWANMFTAMKKSENFHPPTAEALAVGNQFPFSAANHGSGGPMQLAYPALSVICSKLVRG